MTRIRRPGALARRLLQPAGLLLAVLVLAGGPAGQARAEEKALPADLAQVPSDSGFFVTIRVGDLATGKVGKELLSQLRRDKDNLATTREKYLGVPLADVERLTLLLAEEVVIVRTARPYDREKLLDALVPNGKRQKHKDKTFYHEDATGTDVYLVDNQVFLRSHSWSTGKGGLQGGLQRLWDRPAAKDVTLREPLRLAAGKHDIVAGLTPAGLLYGLFGGVHVEGGAAAPRPEVKEGSVKPPDNPRKPPEKEPPASPPPPKPPEKKLEAAPVQLTVFPDEGRSREPSIEDLLRELPPEALPYKPLLQARLATVVGDLGEELKLEVRLTFPDKDVAADGETALRTLLYVARELLPRGFHELGAGAETSRQFGVLLGQMQTALKTAKVTHEGTVVSAATHMEVEAGTIATLAQELSQGAQRTRIENNLRQIDLATINCADTYAGKMPAGIFDKDGKPLLSWRVAILPFIEQDKLYKEFRLDEPWNSEHNRKLIPRMPKVYAGLNARLNEQGKTVFLAPSGKNTAWPGDPNAMRYPASFPDGTSNTILFVLADDEHAVEWTKPDNLKIDSKNPHAGLRQLGGRFVFGMADGSIHRSRPTISKETLLHAFDPADGEVLGSDW